MKERARDGDPLLLPKRLIQTIEDIANEGQRAYLINVLWREYCLALENSGNDEFERLSIEGESMASLCFSSVASA